jgi:hypothetical protein
VFIKNFGSASLSTFEIVFAPACKRGAACNLYDWRRSSACNWPTKAIARAARLVDQRFNPQASYVFKSQVGAGTDNAFGGTSESPFRGDYFMTVTRHEAAHQFDRAMSDRQKALKSAITARCTSNEGQQQGRRLLRDGFRRKITQFA